MSLAVKLVCRGKSFGIPKSKTFERVSRIAEEIVDEMVKSYLKDDWDSSNDFQTTYYHFLFLCGWTKESYEREILERVDKAW